MNLFLFLWQSLACLIHLNWMVCEMGSKWSHSYCFVRCCFQDLLKQHAASLYCSRLVFSSVVSLQLKWCNHTLILIWLQVGRIPILSEGSDFYMVINLSKAVHAFPMHMLILLSVDEILLLRYINWFTNFRGLLFNEKIAPSWLKYIDYFLSSCRDQCLLIIWQT